MLVKFIPMVTAALVLCSCATKTENESFNDPNFHDQDRIADYIKPRDTGDMRELLLTMPLFEISPAERRGWVYANAIMTANSILLVGDGAQTTLKLSRGISQDIYNFEHGPFEDEPVFCYTLRRVSDGWIILSRKTKLIER